MGRVCTYVCMYGCLYVYVYASACVCMPVCVCDHVCVCFLVCVSVCLCVCVERFRVLKDVNRSIYDVTCVSPRNHFLFTPLLYAFCYCFHSFPFHSPFHCSLSYYVILLHMALTDRSTHTHTCVHTHIYTRSPYTRVRTYEFRPSTTVCVPWTLHDIAWA